MADRLFGGQATNLKAITINGAVHVESAEDAEKRKARAAKRKSRWGDNPWAPKASKWSTKDLPSSSNATKLGGHVASNKPTTALVPLGATLPGKPGAAKPNVNQAPAAGTVLGGGIKDDPAAMARARAAANNAVQQGFMQPSIDVSNMDEKTQQIYLLKMTIQEVSLKLNQPNLGIPENPRDRSPSPEPIYNSKGMRINTRLDRTKNKLVRQRNDAITKLKTLDPTYQPPSNFNYKNAQLEERVPIPAEEYPGINFIGLILGPRGNALEEIKKKTNTMISIRGKGVLKNGMTGVRENGKRIDGLDEPLHCWITGTTAEDVKAAAKIIQEMIDMEIYNPDSEKAMALRAKHMYDLAVLNGTLRQADMKCLSCGKNGHATWECLESGSNFTQAVICSSCGGVGHLTSDCQQKRPGEIFNKIAGRGADPKKIDAEYEAFLNDMGETSRDQTKDKKRPDMKLASIHGGIGAGIGAGKGLFSGAVKAPLMLTNGSSAPGAASAAARDASSAINKRPAQMAGGSLVQTGVSMFGGKMTRMTAGYKTHEEIQMEKEKKKEEFNNRPVPLEWQVERYEKVVNKKHDEYLKKLEVEVKEAKRRKAEEEKYKQNMDSYMKGVQQQLLAMGPPPPPPNLKSTPVMSAAPGSSSSTSNPSDPSAIPLPDLGQADPWAALKKS